MQIVDRYKTIKNKNKNGSKILYATNNNSAIENYILQKEEIKKEMQERINKEKIVKELAEEIAVGIEKELKNTLKG